MLLQEKNKNNLKYQSKIRGQQFLTTKGNKDHKTNSKQHNLNIITYMAYMSGNCLLTDPPETESSISYPIGFPFLICCRLQGRSSITKLPVYHGVGRTQLSKCTEGVNLMVDCF